MKAKSDHTNRVLLTATLLLLSFGVQGQQGNTFYLMHQVPQSTHLNPAVQLRCKWFVGMPLISSSHISYNNTAFTYNDLAGSDTWNLYGVYDQMHRMDLYAIESGLNPIFLGFKHRSLYFTFNIVEELHAYQTVPEDLAEIALFGNGPFVGETVRFYALRPAAYYHRQYSLGVSRIMDPSWTIGARVKLLFGKAGLYPSRSRATFSTSEDYFGLLLEGDYTLNSSFPYSFRYDGEGNIIGIEPDDPDYVSLLLNRGNPGLAVDLGAIYRLDERISLSASLLDLGFTRWRTHLNNVNASGSFVFEGVEEGTEIVSGAFVAQMRDSVLNAFDITDSEQPYTSYLPVRLFIGGTYTIKDNLFAGVVNRNAFYRNKVHSSFTLMGGVDLVERFLATISWSYLNNSIRNVGAGIAYHGRGLQFHLVSDNLLGFFYPFNTRTVSLRAGVGLMFGCPRGNREKEIQTETYGPGPKAGNCSWTGNPRKEKKRRKRSERLQNSRI